MSTVSLLHELPRLSTTRAQLFVCGGCVFSWVICRVVGVPLFPYGILIPLLSLAALTDVLCRRIPNWLTYSAFGFALAAAAIVSSRSVSGHTTMPGVIGLQEALAGFAATFGVMLAVYCLPGVGAGDVKLAGAIGACVGVRIGLHAILWAHLFAGTAMLVFVVRRIGPRWLLQRVLSLLFPDRVMMPLQDHSDTMAYPVPMAVYFAFGTMAALVEVQVS